MNWPLNTTYAIGRGVSRAYAIRRVHQLQPFLRGVIEHFLRGSDKAAVPPFESKPSPNGSANQLAAIPPPRLAEDEQRRIAGILGALDDKIELNRRMSQTLEAMAQALFKSWFVDFDPVHAKAANQPTGLPPHLDALFPHSFQESELGEIPSGWEVGSLGDVAVETVRGRTVTAPRS